MPETPNMAIDLSDVAKTFRGRVRALRGIQMHVRRGEVFGLLGPNGAGKSTLVKVLMTVIRPTRCRGTLLGQPVGHKPTLARIGYLPEHHRFADYLTGAQVVDFYGALARVPRRDRRRRTAELLELVGMSEWADKRVRGYSKGMRQRIGIAQALVNDPDLVLLDEPTDGVDPVGRRDIREIIQGLRARGKTVFINSHLLSELEMICDRVAILVQGLVAAQGTLDELTSAQQRYEIEVEGEPGPLPPALPTGEAIAPTGGTIRVATADAARVQGLIDHLRSHGVVLRAVRPFRPSLEDLFMSAVTDPSTGEVLAPGAKNEPRKRGRGGRP
ncbi:MAG: ABC transporter ATP-binding protein [Phycisphaerae bacterium]|nr:ABC transporter ATP-binding protein [Phycisphaerae bacterium]